MKIQSQVSNSAVQDPEQLKTTWGPLLKGTEGSCSGSRSPNSVVPGNTRNDLNKPRVLPKGHYNMERKLLLIRSHKMTPKQLTCFSYSFLGNISRSTEDVLILNVFTLIKLLFKRSCRTVSSERQRLPCQGPKMQSRARSKREAREVKNRALGPPWASRSQFFHKEERNFLLLHGLSINSWDQR